jgi:hypothetical protein
MFNNQQVGAKAKIHKLCENRQTHLKPIFDISVIDGHGNGKIKKSGD